MSSQSKDGAKEEELRPLRSLLGSPNASQLAPDERLLAGREGTGQHRHQVAEHDVALDEMSVQGLGLNRLMAVQ